MARYVYTGDGPHDATMVGGGIVRPGDVREYGDAPDWGAWELVPDEPQKPAKAPAAAPAAAPVPAPAPPPSPAPAPKPPAAAAPAAPENGS